MKLYHHSWWIAPAAIASLGLALVGCPRRDQPPATAYDPEVLETAQEMADANEQIQPEEQPAAEAPGECNWKAGGCVQGFLCWDSWFCKDGRDDRCSASGDKKCHKRCVSDHGCPTEMPRCVERPIFLGTEQGVLEKFCVREED